MSDPKPSRPEGVSLKCLGGALAPPDMAPDLRRFAGLPQAAKRQLWHALGPSLAEPVPPDVERILDAFCARHGVPDDDLARVLKACRFLLRAAVRADLDAAAFGADVDALSGGSDEIRVVLLAGYDAAKALIRREIVKNTVLDHGKLLVGADWRLDRVVSSAHGSNIGAGVAVLTLRYREGDRQERLTLHVLPDALRELRDACDRLLG